MAQDRLRAHLDPDRQNPRSAHRRSPDHLRVDERIQNSRIRARFITAGVCRQRLWPPHRRASQRAARESKDSARRFPQNHERSRIANGSEAKNFDITPSSGEELEALAKQVMAQPPEVVSRVRTIM